MPELFSTSQDITIEQVSEIVNQLRAVNVGGKYVFSRVWLQDTSGGVYICAENWGGIGQFKFYMTEEEKLKVEFD